MAKKSSKPNRTFRAPYDIQHKGQTYRKGEAMPSKYRRFFTAPNDKNNSRKTDNAAGIDSAAPNFGRFVMPQVQTFQGIVTSASHSYLNPDEAIKNCPENALKMERDCFVMECIQARQRGVALLNWHVEPEDARDEKQKAIADIITGIMQQIPRFTEMRRQLLEAVWYGRYAVQTRWGMVKRMGKKYWGIVDTKPIHGDKLAFRYDDGSGEFDENQIGIRVTGARMKNDVMQGNRKLEATTWGMAYFLEPWERDLVVLHKHMIRDAAYEDYLSAGSIHGVGIRSFIYWTWLQMSECMAFLLEYIERTGQGIWIYYYPSGNDQAKQEVETTAEQANRSNVILMPRMSGDPALDAFGIERIDPSPQGAENLKAVIHEFFGHRIKRYVLGQTLSSESDSTGLGSGVADLQYNSYFEIIKYDATNLEETITDEIVKQIVEKNFPEWTDYNFKFKIDTESAEKEKKLASFRQAYDMGARIREADVMDAIGLGAPQDGDVVLQNPTIRQQERLWQQQMQQDGGMGGMPGMDGGMGGGPGGMPPGSPPDDGNGGNGPMGPNGEDLNDLFGPLADGSINAVAQGGGTQWQVQKYSKTGESKPAPTTPDSGKPTTKEQGNSNPIPAPSGSAPAGASAPPGAKPPSGGANAESAAPPSIPKPPKMPGMNPNGAGAGGSPAGTNDAPGGTAEIGKETKPTGGLPSSQPQQLQNPNAGPAPTPGQNPAAAQGQGQQQTQPPQSQPQNQNQAGNKQGQQQKQTQQQQQQPAAQQQTRSQPWNTPEFRAAQPQRQSFAVQHLQKATQTNAMPRSVGGMFRAMMSSPNFKSNAEYVTHDFAPQQAQSIHQELAAHAGREYGGGLVADLSATHGPGAIGYTSPAGAVVITPPTQPGGKWLTHYSANTGVVQRAMSGQPAFGQSRGMIDNDRLAQFDSGKNTRSKVRGDLSALSSEARQADIQAPPLPGQEQSQRFEDIEPEPTNPQQYADTAEKLRAKKTAILDQQLRKLEAGKLSDQEKANYQEQLSLIDAQIKNAGESAKYHEPNYQGWQQRRTAWEQKREEERAKREAEAAKQGQPAAAQPSREELLDPAKIREQTTNMLVEWKSKADAGQLDRHSNAQYKTRVAALKAQLATAESIAKAIQPKPKTLKERQAELDQVRRESEENFNKTGKTLDGRDFHTLTREEFANETGLPVSKHKQFVKDAIERGEELPESVIKQYGELANDYKTKRTRQQALTEAAAARAERIKNAPPPKARIIKNDPNAVNNDDRQYLMAREGLTKEQIDAMDPAEAKAKAQKHREEFQAKQRQESESKLAADRERAELAKQNDEKRIKLDRYEMIEQQQPEVKKKIAEIAGDDHGNAAMMKANVFPSEQNKNAIIQGIVDGRIQSQKELASILNESQKTGEKISSVMSKREAKAASAVDSDKEVEEIVKTAVGNGYREADVRGAIEEAYKEKKEAHQRLKKQMAEFRPSFLDKRTADKAAGGDLKGSSLAKKREFSGMPTLAEDYVSGMDSKLSEMFSLSEENPNGTINEDWDQLAIALKKYAGGGVPSDADVIRFYADGVPPAPKKSDSDVIGLAETYLGGPINSRAKKQTQPNPDSIGGDDFWDAFSDTPPESFQEGPPEQPEREPGMDEDEDQDEPEAESSAKKKERDDSPVPFRKSIDSAARIKYLRQQRPDLFAI